VTPTIALISGALADAVTTPDRQFITTCPHRTDKTALTSVVASVFAFSPDPDAPVIVKSYGDELVEESSREARRLIAVHSDVVGIDLAQTNPASDAGGSPTIVAACLLADSILGQKDSGQTCSLWTARSRVLPGSAWPRTVAACAPSSKASPLSRLQPVQGASSS
jgi:hypothetical protein